MGWVSPNVLTHHLDRKRRRSYRPIEAHLNMTDDVQWKSKRESKATVHAISDDGIRETHFDAEDVARFIEKFGPSPEDVAMKTLVGMSDEKLLAFFGQMLKTREENRAKKK